MIPRQQSISSRQIYSLALFSPFDPLRLPSTPPRYESNAPHSPQSGFRITVTSSAASDRLSRLSSLTSTTAAYTCQSWISLTQGLSPKIRPSGPLITPSLHAPHWGVVFAFHNAHLTCCVRQAKRPNLLDRHVGNMNAIRAAHLVGSSAVPMQCMCMLLSE